MPSLRETRFPFIYAFTDDTRNPTFLLTVKEALEWIDSKPVGHSLLSAISGARVAPGEGGFKVKIVRPDAEVTIGQPGAEGGSRSVAFNENAARGGAGCLVACYWNPNIWNTSSAAGARPAFIGLAHELVHCMHALLGTTKTGHDDEEKFTVGLPPYANVPICENTIRAEHGVNVRESY